MSLIPLHPQNSLMNVGVVRPLNPCAQNRHFLAKIEGWQKACNLPVSIIYRSVKPKGLDYEDDLHTCHSGLAGRKFSDQKNYEYYLTTGLDYYDNYSSDDGTVVIRFHNRDFGLIGNTRGRSHLDSRT